VSKFNFFTSFHNALSDPAAYSSFQKEMNLKAVEQTFFNSFVGKPSFRAVVLPENLKSASNKPNSKIIRIRPLEIHDFILPEPCSFSDPEKIQKVLLMHPVAYPDSSYPFLGGNLEGVDPVGYGHIVECFFKDGPQGGGRLRRITYRAATIGLMKSFNLKCLGVRIETFSDSDNLSGDRSGATVDKVSEFQKNYKISQYKPYEPPPPELELGPFDLDEDAEKYVVNSIRDNIKTFKTIENKTYSPQGKTYLGKIESHQGQVVENGLLPKEILGQLPPGIVKDSRAAFSRGLFIIDVIPDLQRLAMAFKEHFGAPLNIGDSYRNFNRQIATKNSWIRKGITRYKSKITEDMPQDEKDKLMAQYHLTVKYAAPPGTSNHGWGLAMDIDTSWKGKSGFASEIFDWMLVNAPIYGFHSPPWARNETGIEESWHFEWLKLDEIFKK
jgi:hypothetical protein